MPRNMKYDAVATKAAGPKKKMKTNQDGGSMTAKDPSAAGREIAANQAGAAKYKEGPAQRQRINNQTATKEGKDMVPDKMLKRGDVRADGSIVGETMNKNEGVGPSRMGYSQKFGPGRMNGYDAGAKRVMDVMTHGGASKYMAEGPGQGKFDAMNERLRINKDEARTQAAIAKQRDITSMQADVKDGTRPAFSNPSINPIDGMTYSYGARLLKGGDKMIDPAASSERNVTRGADGYYTANAFPRNRRSARSREEFTGTYGRDRGQKETPYIRGSFDYAKRRYEQDAQRNADYRNRMINEFKGKVGIDVNRERRAAVQNKVSAIFNRGIGSVKNSTAKNPTGLESYKTKEIN